MAAIPPLLAAMIVSPDDMMRKGLKHAGFDDRSNKANRLHKYRRFKAWYGSDPIVYAQLWEDLVTTEIAEARIRPEDDLDRFLMSLYFLKAYTSEEHRSGIFKLSEKTAREWTWVG
jgi:hypothetical protein